MSERERLIELLQEWGNKENDGVRAENEQEINQIKSEAIKEFAKYIIDKSQNGIIQVSDIHDYVKEMTEAQE